MGYSPKIAFLLQPDVKDYIAKNISKNVQDLILRPPKEWKDQISWIADQIQARQKCKSKLPEWSANMELIMPPPLSIEQSSSHETATYKTDLLSSFLEASPSSTFIDLTGGMGIDCLYLSTPFSTCYYIEQNQTLCDIFKHNAAVLSRQIAVENTTAEAFLGKFAPVEKPVAFLDPARRDADQNRVFRLGECSPDLSKLMPMLRDKVSIVLIKLSPLLDLQAVIAEVPSVRAIHIVSVKNDCKELLLHLDFAHKGRLSVVALNLGTHQKPYQFYIEEEQTTAPPYGTPKKYLYEPNASVLKAGAFKKVAKDFELEKLHPNTHLYTSNEVVDDFPGKIYEVMCAADKKSMATYAPAKKINVVTRNYPLSPAELKKKYKLKDGGAYFLIGFRDIDEKAQLLIVNRKT